MDEIERRRSQRHDKAARKHRVGQIIADDENGDGRAGREQVARAEAFSPTVKTERHRRFDQQRKGRVDRIAACHVGQRGTDGRRRNRIGKRQQRGEEEDERVADIDIAALPDREGNLQKSDDEENQRRSQRATAIRLYFLAELDMVGNGPFLRYRS